MVSGGDFLQILLRFAKLMNNIISKLMFLYFGGKHEKIQYIYFTGRCMDGGKERDTDTDSKKGYMCKVGNANTLTC